MQEISSSPQAGSAQDEQENAAQARRDREEQTHAWLTNLVRELFQTEQSASTHPIVEAERLGDVPPAHTLRAIAGHAEAVLAELPSIAKRHHLPESDGGKLAGSALSKLRDHGMDLLVNSEKSYRGTLIGMRHGVDLVELIGYAAQREGDTALATWCEAWLERRRPLVEAAARNLAWFGEHPERAVEPAKDSLVARAAQGVVKGLESVAGKLRDLGPDGN